MHPLQYMHLQNGAPVRGIASAQALSETPPGRYKPSGSNLDPPGTWDLLRPWCYHSMGDQPASPRQALCPCSEGHPLQTLRTPGGCTASSPGSTDLTPEVGRPSVTAAWQARSLWHHYKHVIILLPG